MIEFSYIGRIIDKHLPIHIRERINNFLVENDNEVIEIILRPFKNKRSASLNRLYWGYYLNEIANFTGHTPTEIHLWMKHLFLGYEVIEISGEMVKSLKSTKTLTNEQFTNYLHEINFFAKSELGIDLPNLD